jgi:3-oxoacyl-[acyl-carrier-protein] synthase II
MSLVSFGQTSDAYRLTDGRDDAKYVIRAIELAITNSGLSKDQLAFVKAHGTSTVLNDRHEAMAIESVFEKNNIPVTSLKGHLGHTTDASGLIENLIAASFLKTGWILPTKNCFDSSEFNINIVKINPIQTSSRYFLSNSIGFGGYNSSAIIKIL